MSDLGGIITSLGVTGENITDTDLPAAAVVLMKIVSADGKVRLWMGYSDGMSWIERLGMLTAANDMEMPSRAAYWADRDDDGD